MDDLLIHGWSPCLQHDTFFYGPFLFLEAFLFLETGLMLRWTLPLLLGCKRFCDKDGKGSSGTDHRDRHPGSGSLRVPSGMNAGVRSMDGFLTWQN